MALVSLAEPREALDRLQLLCVRQRAEQDRGGVHD